MGAEVAVKAVEMGYKDGLDFLLEKKADLSYNNCKVLFKAVEAKQPAMLKFLTDPNNGQPPLDVNAKRNWDEFSPIHLACMGGDLPMMAHLLQCKADPDAKLHDSHCRVHNGWSSIHLAAEAGSLDVLRLLLQEKASIELPTLQKETAVVLAAENGHSNVVKLLVEAGALKESVRMGLTSIQWALYRGDHELVEFLVRKGAQVKLDTKVLWFAEDKAPVFGQHDFEDHDLEKEKALHEDLSKVKKEAEQRARRMKEIQIRQEEMEAYALQVGGLAKQEDDPELFASQQREVADRVERKTRDLFNPEKEEQEKANRKALYKQLPPSAENKTQGLITLQDVLLRDYSPAVVKKLMHAIENGRYVLRTNKAIVRQLQQITWEPPKKEKKKAAPAVMTFSNDDGAAAPPVEEEAQVFAFSDDVSYIMASYLSG